jgi:zinc protease
VGRDRSHASSRQSLSREPIVIRREVAVRASPRFLVLALARADLAACLLLAVGLAAGPTARAQSPPASPVQPAKAGGGQAPAIKVPYTRFKMANGLTVILHEDHTVPVVAVNVWYHVGSAREKPGRTGFAHLFEHIMFEGSEHVKEGEFDTLLEGVGGDNNGSTTSDRTNYWENVPSNAVEIPLFLESDRMGFLLPSLSPARVDQQRDVVKNERRQSYENEPYGMAEIVLGEMLFPPGHPYHWPTIGYMDDLTAASYEDVVDFFKKYYGPNNASLVVAGDIDEAGARRIVEKWFGDVKPGEPVAPLAAPMPALFKVERRTLADRVQLPRLYLAWITPPLFEPGDAALDAVSSVLAGGKNSRLYKRLVYDLQIAQDVSAFQESRPLVSSFQIVVTPRPGHTVEEVRKIVDEELDRLRAAPPTGREMARMLNQTEASFYGRMERVGGFGGIADQLNAYYTETGAPDYFAQDLARYRVLTPADVQAAARHYLPANRRVELAVLPERTKQER